jgi:hypothetical protein
MIDRNDGRIDVFLPKFIFQYLALCSTSFIFIFISIGTKWIFWIFLSFLLSFGGAGYLFFVLRRNCSFSLDGIELVSWNRRVHFISWKNIQRSVRINDHQFKLLSGDGTPLILDLKFIGNIGMAPLPLLKEFLNEISDASGVERTWEGRVLLPRIPEQGKWYAIKIPQSSNQGIRTELIALALLLFACVAYQLIAKKIKVGLIVPFLVVAPRFSVYARFFRARKNEESISFQFSADLTRIQTNGFDYKIPNDQRQNNPIVIGQSTLCTTNPVPFEWGWNWTAPDGTKVYFDPRFIVEVQENGRPLSR